jgi:hypothetical protein
MCRVAASGEAYCRVPIASNAGARQLFDTGVPGHIDLMLEIWQLADATAQLLRRPIEKASFAALAANQRLPGCQGKLCVFLCNNCSIHCSEPILARFAENGVAIINYPLHTSHIFQVLDVLLFGRLNAAKK